MNPSAVRHAKMLSVLILFIAKFTVVIFTGCHAIDKQRTLVQGGKAASSSSSLEAVNSETCKLQPVGKTEYRLGVELIAGGNLGEITSRRKLEPFQECLVCKCCMAPGGSNCVNMPCCFGIDCQLPNKPFGVCAFVPKFCNCTSCAV